LFDDITEPIKKEEKKKEPELDVSLDLLNIDFTQTEIPKPVEVIHNKSNSNAVRKDKEHDVFDFVSKT